MFGRSLGLRLAISVAVIFVGSMLVFAITQETPVGSLAGTARALESGIPLQAEVRLATEGHHKFYRTYARPDGSFNFNSIPSGKYNLEASTRVHTFETVPIEIEEGKTRRLNLELKPNKPNLEVFVHEHVYSPTEHPQISCQGFVPGDLLSVRLFNVDINAFLVDSGGSLNALLGKEAYADQSKPTNLDAVRALTLAQSRSVKIAKRDFEGVFNQRMDFPLMFPGVYVVEVKAGGVQKLEWMMVTSLGMVTKTSGRQVLVDTVNLKTGAPVASSEVTIYVGKSKVASGRTGVDGLLSIDLPSTEKGENHQTILAKSGSSIAFVSTYLSSMEDTSNIIYAYTERPVYKPGQRVFFKGIVRKMLANGYKVPTPSTVQVEVRDGNDTLIYRASKRTDNFGSYAGDFTLNSETATGSYSLTSSIQGHGRGQTAEFRVAAYRKPEYNVKVKFDQPRYVRNETTHAKVSANYYFGPPVTDAKLHYVIRRTPYWLFGNESDDEGEGTEGYRDYGGYGDVVQEGDTRTDENGEADIQFAATWPQPTEKNASDTDQQFSVEVSATDKSQQEVTGSASTIVTRGEFALTATPDRYVLGPGEAANLQIQAMDYDKHPIAGQSLTVLIGYEKWSNDEAVFHVTHEQEVTTDKTGRAFVKLKSGKEEEIEAVVLTRDTKGNKISDTSIIEVYNGGFGQEPEGRLADLKVVTDKKTYNPGDTAKVLIMAKKSGDTALLTVEGARIYEKRLVHLTGKATLVEVPVKSEYKPNFYVGACFVRDGELSEQETGVKVSLSEQALQISVAPNKSKYRPGEQAVYKIKAVDSKGKPAYSQLSVGVVDEAIYAIEEEHTTPILDYFYAHRANRVDTNFSFPRIYLSDPDKAGTGLLTADGKNIRIRKKFLDTAFWSPMVTTDRNGEATVKFTMPDNLTSWRATVRGITLDSSCGESKSKVIAQQDFLVRLETPRFLVQSDTSTIAAVVHNYTGSGRKVTVDLRAPGVDVKGRTQRSVYVKDGGAERVEWEISASRPGDVEITASAASGRFGDAMQLVLPVNPHGARRESATVGSIQETANKSINLDVRADSVRGATTLRVRFAPSLASSMLGSVEYLAQYPWGCTEQTTSSFLPDVILSRSMKNLGLSNPKLQAELPDMVNKGLSRLYRFQLEDGGWSWYEYGKSDPWMTAYVCYGLLRARDSGFAVNEQALDRGVVKLKGFFDKPQTSQTDGFGDDSWYEGGVVDTKVYCAYVVSMAGYDITAKLGDIPARSNLDGKTMALLALTYDYLHRRSEAKTMLDRLLAHGTQEPGVIHWWGRNHYCDEIETNAVALEALLQISPNDPRASQIVTWLMQRRQGDAWYSTRDTAMVLYAMSNYLKVTHELAPNFDAEVLLNGESIGKKHFDRYSLFDPEFEVTAPSRLIRTGRNSLEIRKTGAGNLYYSTKLIQFAQQDLSTPTVTNGGLTITREYYHPTIKYYEDYSDQYLDSPVRGATVGDMLTVRLTINAKNPVSHLLVEDSIPAGCEIVDRGAVGYNDWSYWWVGQDVRDDRISFYLDEFPAGKRVLEYRMRAGFRGNYHALPAQVFGMYMPENRASTVETGFEIR